MGIINQLTGKEHSSQSGLSRTLRKLGYTPQMYYDEFLKQEGEGCCLLCGNQTKFWHFKYNKFCNVKCAADFNQNSTKMWDKLTGTDRQEFITRLSVSIKEAHPKGGKWLEKRNQTIIDRYGITELEMQKNRFVERLNKLTPEEHTTFYDKATSASRKAGAKFKQYSLNGEIVNIQGYENLVLDVLKKYIPENQIQAGRDIGFYRYISVSGKKRRYFPDIRIENYILEIKSSFTLGRDPDLLNKMQSIIDANLIPLLVVWNPKQMEMCEKDLIETISSQSPIKFWGRFNDYPFIGVGYKQMIAEVLGTQLNGL